MNDRAFIVVQWVPTIIGQSARQGQIYNLFSHHLHVYSYYCSVTVLTTHSPLVTVLYFNFRSGLTSKGLLVLFVLDREDNL